VVRCCIDFSEPHTGSDDSGFWEGQKGWSAMWRHGLIGNCATAEPISLAFLAPSIVKAVVECQLPRGSAPPNPPVAWTHKYQMPGLSS
jgi:hypothetical protein